MKIIKHNQGLSTTATIGMVAVAAIIVVAGGGAWYYFSNQSSTNIYQQSNPISNPINDTSQNNVSNTNTNQNSNNTSTPTTPTPQDSANTSTSVQSSTADACSYLTASEVGSVTGVTVQARNAPMGSNVLTSCLYTTGTYTPVAVLAISTALAKAPDSAIALGYQSTIKSKSTVPVQGIGDMAAETISSDSVTIIFWKNKINGTLTLTNQGTSAKSQAESLAKMVASKM